jgi:hypothetical protein
MCNGSSNRSRLTNLIMEARSSGKRATQSKLGFAFALFNQIQRIPTHIFVYDKDNILRYVDTLEKLCLVPTDMGSNYQLNHNEMEQLLRDTLRLERGSIFESIRAIEVRSFGGYGSKVCSSVNRKRTIGGPSHQI